MKNKWVVLSKWFSGVFYIAARKIYPDYPMDEGNIEFACRYTKDKDKVVKLCEKLNKEEEEHEQRQS